jgi:hypothetical protein
VELHSVESSSASHLSLVELPEELRPKGIEPKLLLNQVFNTAPYLKHFSLEQPISRRYLTSILSHHSDVSWDDFSYSRYFELCVAAHFSTCATFVPTDVDNHIRFKLWNPAVSEEELLKMVETVIESFAWDTTIVSTRWLRSPAGRIVEGHKGEWFSLAAAAYGACRFRLPLKAKELLQLIEWEIENEALVFKEFKEAGDGISLLKTSVLIAHNLGDLDRVIEMWGLKEGEPLFELSRKCQNNSPYSQYIKKAGELNRDIMALENHRHFCLRQPRPLRKSVDFLLPLGPFFDSWGKILATHPDLSLEDLGVIIEALLQGWSKLTGPVGYARALVGLETNYPGGMKELLKPLPSRVAKLWTTGPLRQLCTVSQSRFEAQWNQLGLKKS